MSTPLTHFEKRVAGSISRGPLVRFSIGKTTPRIDFTEIGTNLKPAEAILNHILSRSDVPIQIDPSGYQADENCETRFRRFISYANSFRRDSGIDGRTLGFPFLLVGPDPEIISEIGPFSNFSGTVNVPKICPFEVSKITVVSLKSLL